MEDEIRHHTRGLGGHACPPHRHAAGPVGHASPERAGQRINTAIVPRERSCHKKREGLRLALMHASVPTQDVGNKTTDI